MPISWELASDNVLHIAEELINKYHRHLLPAKIGFLFRSEAGSSGGRSQIGNVSCVSPKMQAYVDLDFVIWLSKPDWDRMTDLQHHAIIDHELYHIWDTGEGYKLVSHDIEEFAEVLDRYGLWKSDLESCRRTFTRAVALPGMERTGKVEAVDLDKFQQHLDHEH